MQLTVSYDELPRMAKVIATSLSPGMCVALSGDLGAGKTALSAAIIRALCGQECDVTSPTFTIANQYHVPDKGVIWHVDCYRLEDAREFVAIGGEEFFRDITLIEWPGIITSYLPNDRLMITIDYISEHTRQWNIQAYGQCQRMLAAFRAQ